MAPPAEPNTPLEGGRLTFTLGMALLSGLALPIVLSIILGVAFHGHQVPQPLIELSSLIPYACAVVAVLLTRRPLAAVGVTAALLFVAAVLTMTLAGYNVFVGMFVALAMLPVDLVVHLRRGQDLSRALAVGAGLLGGVLLALIQLVGYVAVANGPLGYTQSQAAIVADMVVAVVVMMLAGALGWQLRQYAEQDATAI